MKYGTAQLQPVTASLSSFEPPSFIINDCSVSTSFCLN